MMRHGFLFAALATCILPVTGWAQVPQDSRSVDTLPRGVAAAALPQAGGGPREKTDTSLIGPAWDSYTGNWQGFAVNVGSYPASALFGSGSVPIAEALSGMVNIPAISTRNNHAAGISGYGRSASTTQGGVGVFGWSMMAADGAQGWGANFGVTNCGTPNCIGSAGHSGATLYGLEMDVNVAPLANGGTPTGGARGIYLVGGSTVRPTSGLTGVEFDSPGMRASPRLHWTYALKSNDGSADVFATVGALDERTNFAAGSQPILFRSHSATGASHLGAITQDATGTLVLSSASGAAVSGGALRLQPSGPGVGRGSVGLDLVGVNSAGVARSANVTADADGNLVVSSKGLVVLTGAAIEVRGQALLGITVIAQHTPTSSSEPCTPGQISDDTIYHYWCATKNHWLRIKGAAFP